MKKYFYIASFSFLGILLGFLLHAAVEIFLINFFLASLLESWFVIHTIWSVLTFGGGLLFGFWQGKHWWKVIYEKNSTQL